MNEQQRAALDLDRNRQARLRFEGPPQPRPVSDFVTRVSEASKNFWCVVIGLA